MRRGTLLDLARTHGIRLPEVLTSDQPVRVHGTDEKGWFRFQRLYDTARSVLQQEADVRRLLHEVAADERADGSGWLEIQVDPSGYANRFDGLTAFVDLVLDAAADASARSGVGIGVVVGANRTKHPLEARTLARLAAQYAGRGVVGFGLANDERRGRAEDFEAAFRIAGRAGLPGVPHGGELVGAPSVRACVEALGARRVGHGIRAAEDPAVVRLLAERGVTCEVCPASNLALGVYRSIGDLPLGALVDGGVQVALGADDPLLFGARLTDQYELVREGLGVDDETLAALAAASVRASAAPVEVRERLLAGIDGWLALE
jgi:adenosine deaminase